MKNYHFNNVRILKNPRTKEDIGIMCFFDDGSTSQFYPEDTKSEWFIFFLKSIREENNLDRKNRYYEDYSLDGQAYEPAFQKRYESSPAWLLNESDHINLIQMFLDTLTPIQFRRLSYRLDNPKMSLREISRLESANHKAAEKTYSQIKKKLEIFIDAHNLYWLRRKISS